jgi:hypothetical protein
LRNGVKGASEGVVLLMMFEDGKEKFRCRLEPYIRCCEGESCPSCRLYCSDGVAVITAVRLTDYRELMDLGLMADLKERLDKKRRQREARADVTGVEAALSRVGLHPSVANRDVGGAASTVFGGENGDRRGDGEVEGKVCVVHDRPGLPSVPEGTGTGSVRRVSPVPEGVSSLPASRDVNPGIAWERKLRRWIRNRGIRLSRRNRLLMAVSHPVRLWEFKSPDAVEEGRDYYVVYEFKGKWSGEDTFPSSDLKNALGQLDEYGRLLAASAAGKKAVYKVLVLNRPVNRSVFRGSGDRRNVVPISTLEERFSSRKLQVLCVGEEEVDRSMHPDGRSGAGHRTKAACRSVVGGRVAGRRGERAPAD